MWIQLDVDSCTRQDKINGLDENIIQKDNLEGYILEVHLEYPKELHDLHNDYRLAPEKIEITESMLSDYCRKIVISKIFQLAERNFPL